MRQVYRITYPNGKIYVGIDHNRDAEAVRPGDLHTRPLDQLWNELGIEADDAQQGPEDRPEG